MVIPKYPIPGWGIDEAEDARLWHERQVESARLDAIPEYVKRKRDLRDICFLLSDLLFVDTHEFSMPDKHNSTVTYLAGKAESKSNKPRPYGIEGLEETQAYRDFQQRRSIFCSRLCAYSSTFGTNPWDTLPSRNQTETHAYFGHAVMDIIKDGLKRASEAFDVGASLYLYQQMHDRQLDEHPTLSKAAWLVKNAPIRKPASDKHIPRGKWGRIQEHWKDHFDYSHYWAAIVTLTKSPLQFNDNLLLALVCDPDLDQLYRLAQTFLEFRQRVTPPRFSATKPMYLKQRLPMWEIDPAERVDPLDIPNLLEDFQWEALSRYSPSKHTI
jgi:hypothetical protein